MDPTALVIPNSVNVQPALSSDDENPHKILICNVGRTRSMQANHYPRWDWFKTDLPSSLAFEFIRVLQIMQRHHYIVQTALYSYEEATIIFDTQDEDWSKRICTDCWVEGVEDDPPSPIHPQQAPSLSVTCVEVGTDSGGSLDDFVAALEKVKTENLVIQSASYSVGVGHIYVHTDGA